MEENTYLNIFNSISDAIYILDEKACFVTVNHGAEQMYGYPKEFFTGKTPVFLGAEGMNDLESVGVCIQKAYEGEPQVFEFWGVRKDGSIFPKEVRLYPGNFEGKRAIIAVGHDITQRKKDDQLRIERESFQKVLLDNVQAGIMIIDPETHIIENVNQFAAQLYGQDSNDIIGKICHNFLCPADRGACPITDLNQDLDNSDRFLLKNDGSRIPILKTVKKVVINGKEKLLESFIDISERVNSEVRLKESEENFRALFESMDEIILVTSFDGKIIYANQALTSKLGYSSTDIISQHILILHPSEFYEDAKNVFKDILTYFKKECAIPLLKKDGHYLPVETKIWAGNWNGQEVFFSISKDLSEQKAALEKFQKLFNSNPALMAITSYPDRIFLDVNTSFIKTMGYSREELIGKKAADFNIYAMEDEKKYLLDEGFRQGSINNLEISLRKKNGDLIVGLFSLERIVNHREKLYLSVLTDITAQKKAEEEAKSASIAKSRFLANMSHEIRTPLNGVIGFTDLLMKSQLSRNQAMFAESILTSASSLMDLINDILDFSKIESGQLDIESIETDLFNLVSHALDIVKYHADQKKLELILDISPGLPRLCITDPTRLRQVLINLLSNAIKFTDKGQVVLKVESLALNPGFKEIRLKFSVKDSGIGIADYQKKNLFKSFSQADSSTTRKYGGTGLGLAISSKIIEKLGGQIEVMSEPGKGSDFSFTLSCQYVTEKESKLILDQHIREVMIVDDHPMVRHFLCETLSYLNVECHQMENGLKALEKIASRDKFDAILLDYSMPYMNGLEVYQKIKDLYPDYLAKTIIMLNSSDELKVFMNNQVRNYLLKPVKPDQLINRLNDLYTPDNFSNDQVNKLVVKTNDLSKQKYRVLIAEDNTINMILARTIMENYLKSSQIIEAINGVEAVEKYRQYKPHLILMDIHMPEKDGYTATTEIRYFEKSSGKRVPIIALTAGAIHGERDKCLEVGMDDFITKPVLSETIIGICNQWLPDLSDIKEENLNCVGTVCFNKEKLMEKIAGNMDVYHELVSLLYNNMDNYITQMKADYAERNFDGIKKIAHHIKGAALNMCFEHIAELCRKIEDSLINDQDKIPSLISDLQNMYEAVKNEI